MKTEVLKGNATSGVDIFIPRVTGSQYPEVGQSTSKESIQKSYHKVMQLHNLCNQKVAVFHLVSFGTLFFLRFSDIDVASEWLFKQISDTVTLITSPSNNSD